MAITSLPKWSGFVSGSAKGTAAQKKQRKARASKAFNKSHPNGRVIEKDELVDERIDPYTLHPDSRIEDPKGHMGTDVTVYDATGAPVARIIAATRERVPYGQNPVAPISRPIYRSMAVARKRMKDNFAKGPIVRAIATHRYSPKIVGARGVLSDDPDSSPALEHYNRLRRAVRAANPGV